MQQKPTIAICIVHNHDRKRLSILMPNVSRFAESLNAKVYEFYDQPAIKAVATLTVVKRLLIRTLLEQKWRLYCEIPGKSGFELIREYINSVKSSLFCGRVPRKKIRRAAHIETIVASKHVEAWRTYKQRCRYLLVLEDDALFQHNTGFSFAEIIEFLDNNYAEGSVFVNLSGGYSLSELGISSLATERAGILRGFDRPVTNTACAYLLNARAAEQLVEMLNHRPWYRNSPIDWLMNGLFMDLIKQQTKIFCWHAIPPLWQHGSMDGSYTAWER